jgi:hypothetical protein
LSSSNNVTRYRKRREFNVGFIVFLIILVYILITVYIYFTKDHLSIYEVKEGSTSDDNVFTGLIIRDEEIFSTENAGYVNYYHRDGDRIAKNSTVYSIDENQKSSDLISDDESSIKLSSDDNSEIKKEIYNFQKSYANNDFSTVYDFKLNLENTVMQIVNDSMLATLAGNVNGTSSTFRIVNSKSSGIITYSMDNMEEISQDSITADAFKTDNYSKTQLRTMDIVETNTPIYKLIKSDEWAIVLLLKEEQYEKLKDKEYIKITFAEDGLITTVPVSVYQKGTDYFARLNLNKYMVRYLGERYVTVELAINSAKGLKIPVSSIVKKEFYTIPLEFFTEGGDTGSTGLIAEKYNEKNEEFEYIFVPTDIYYKDDKYGYVDSRLFEKGDPIHSEKSGEKFQIGPTETLDGVYNVNKGYAIFRRIEVLYENEEYCIIKKGTEYGLSVYDHIALNSKTAVEQAIIY